MAQDATNNPGPFNVATVKALVQLMNRNDISEIDLRDGERRIRLLRGGASIVPISPPSEMPAPARSAAPAAETPAPAKPSKKPLYEIKAPTPGTFYSKPNPEAEAYVKVGSKVTSETVVCLLEAMKLFTEITAEVDGVIAEILVQNEQPVEYGTVLFRVDTSG